MYKKHATNPFRSTQKEEIIGPRNEFKCTAIFSRIVQLGGVNNAHLERWSVFLLSITSIARSKCSGMIVLM